MPLLADPPEDQDLVQACRVLGRALYIASGFEDDCRVLAFALKIREPQPDGQTDEEFITALSTAAVFSRLVDLNKLIASRAMLAEDYAAMLHAARKARNYIAHEAVTELDQLTKTLGGVSEWLSILGSKLDEITRGKIIVAVLLSRNTASQKPTKEVIIAYPNKIRSWVLQA